MSTLRILQWNMGIYKVGKDVQAEARRALILDELLRKHQPDIVALQEAPRQQAERVLLQHRYAVSTPVHRLVTAWRATAWGPPVQDPISYSRVSAVVLSQTTPTGTGRAVLVCNVHLPSPGGMGRSPRTTVQSLQQMVRELESYRTTTGQRGSVSEIIIGDFNLEPHVAEVQEATGLYGNRSLQYVATREAKWRGGKSARALYNPSWCLYGAKSAPHGTYYFEGLTDEPWYVFDQAFFSSDLVTKPAEFKLITRVGPYKLLLAKTSAPDKTVGSDHLPVLWLVEPTA